MAKTGLLRIVHVLNHVRKANGHVCVMVDLACAQAALGHDVHVFSGGGDFEDLLRSHGIVHSTIIQERKPLILLRALAAMLFSFRRLKPDIVHVHMMTSAVLVAAVRPLCGFKFVTTVHNDFEKSATLMGLGQRVIAVSNAVRYAMIKRGVSSAKLRTVLNGTIGSPRLPEKITTIPLQNRPAITFVGGLHPRKGVPDLIEAHAEVVKFIPTAHLYIVGSGPFELTYKELAARYASGNVTFCGHADDPRSYLVESDIFTLPSHAEPAGLVISEAREVGCAVVASDVGGIPEMVEGGKAGILVPPGKPDQLAAAILRLLQEPSYLAEMRARSQYNIENMALSRVVDETLQIYHELLC